MTEEDDSYLVSRCADPARQGNDSELVQYAEGETARTG